MEPNSIPLLERQFKLTEKKLKDYEFLDKSKSDPFSRNKVQYWRTEKNRVMRILGYAYNDFMNFKTPF